MVEKKYNTFISLCMDKTSDYCIYGAGEYGQGWVFELLTVYAGLNISFFVDRDPDKKAIYDIPVKSPDYLYDNKDKTICFVGLSPYHAESVTKELRAVGIKYFVLDDQGFVEELYYYIEKVEDEYVRDCFKGLMDDELFLKNMWRKCRDTELDLTNPKTLNEKLQWLKIHDRKDIYTRLTDKYLAREYIINNFGEEYVPRLLFRTRDVRDLTYDNIPETPCIIKTNCGCHDYTIIREKKEIDICLLQDKYKRILRHNFYYHAREWQYKNIEPQIIIEELLVCENGRIPNDYKLIFLNGKVQFVYCSIDREGKNYRKVYDTNWKSLPFVWTTDAMNLDSTIGDDIPQPKSFDKMLRFGERISRDLPFVRVDYYDVDGRLYCGEITLCHGAGFDRFFPESFDLFYGSKLSIERSVRYE